ncbi:MAG: 33 kDa chaperonin [Leptospiraceae bacterium]|nr:MAG: 33 kDa chaperonin [Leptospiraceae bacterium]GIX43460.1 MAG: 33 kDa chaperonin [Leptospiraceae bacterium]
MKENKEYIIMPQREKDIFVRGIIPDLNVRFLFANIKETLIEIRNLQNLSIQCEALLGETILGAFLLTTREIKQEHEVIGIHIEGDGAVKKILAFASSFGGVRGIIVPEDASWEGKIYKGKGKGILQVNKFKLNSKKVYSSAVEMRDVPIAKNLEEYISKSDQINAFIGIYSFYDSNNPLLPVEVYGYFFEVLPDTKIEQIDKLTNFIYKTDMIEFLKNIFGEQIYEQKKELKQQFSVRILQSGSIFFYCDCNAGKIENVLFTLGKDEVFQILEEQKQIEITCEFCKKKYIFTENDIIRLFKEKE